MTIDLEQIYPDVKHVIINHGIPRTSRSITSYIQRRWILGYARAAKLVDMLEEDGVIGPPDGSKPRQILIKLNEE